MSSPRTYLTAAFEDIKDAISDFQNASFQSCVGALKRFTIALNEEPMAGFLHSALPSVDFDAWYQRINGSVGSMVGSGVLDWPPDRPSRVAMQIALCKAIVDERIQFLDFVHDYMYSERELSGHVYAFAANLLEPLARDISRLSQTRPVPPILFEAMGSLPASGDAILDQLLKDARLKFRDPTPMARTEAVEKLWDAWERLKTLEVQGDKRMSASKLLDQCASEPTFRAVLEAEARALTQVGNAFHIRHFETDKVALVEPEHADYLFHRLFALIYLLLFSRTRGSGE